MNDIIYALMIVAKVAGYPDTQAAMFATRDQCMQEARQIIQQGPSAYCMPMNRPADPKEAVAKMTAIMRSMMDQMNKDLK